MNLDTSQLLNELYLSGAGSFLDQYLIRKKQITYDDFTEKLKEQVILSGEIEVKDLNEYFQQKLRLSGDIRFEDFNAETKNLIAINGAIDYEDLNQALKNRFIYKNINEQALAPDLAFKINNRYSPDYIVFDCGSFEDINDDIIDGGDW